MYLVLSAVMLILFDFSHLLTHFSSFPIEQRGRFAIEIEGRFEVVLEQQWSRVEIECPHDFRLQTTPSLP